MSRSKILMLVCMSSIVCIGGVTLSHVKVSAADSNCSSVEIVFARGSGQDLGKSPEEERFKKQMSSHITAPLTQTYYELGTEAYGGFLYNPVDVGNVWNGNAIGAKFSAGYGFDYGNSVNNGVGELTNYLTQRYDKCKNAGSKYVLGGYSQGAQVVGQTLPKLSVDLRSKIVFVSLFGDPKLSLPEGEGLNPPACHGENLSPCRRVIANCNVDNGSLGARQPYVPDDMKNKVGLWCYAYDFVCGSSKDPTEIKGHGWYGLEAHAVDMAVGETIARLSPALTPEQAQHLVWMKNPTATSGGLDVTIIIDTTDASGGRIEKAKAFARATAEKVIGQNGRVALVECRDYGDMVIPLVSNVATFQEGLDSLRTTGGKNEKPAIPHALLAALNVGWQDGASKAIMVLSGSSYDQADADNKAMLTDVVKRTLEIDPVNVYPVVSDELRAVYQPIAEQTSGKVIVDAGDTAAMLDQTFTAFNQRPVALLKMAEYSADPGQQITFDASDSTVNDGAITNYDWDYDGDGTFDESTTTPVVRHTYPSTFDGMMQVRVAASNGTTANASAKVKIGTKVQPVLPTAPANLTTTVLTTANNVSTVQLSWTPSDTFATQWVVSVNDVAVGRAEASTTTVELTDVQRGDDVQLSVARVDANNNVGQGARVMLTKITPTPPPAPDPTPPKKRSLHDLLKLIIKVIKIVVVQVRGH